VILLVASLALGVFGVAVHQSSSEVRNLGFQAPGILVSYAEIPERGEGLFAEVSFGTSGGSFVATSQEPVVGAGETMIGKAFAVYSDPEDSSRTHIQGIDSLEAPVLAYAAALAALFLGLVTLLFPPGRERPYPAADPELA
jgi:hypothetical protein